MIIRIWHGYTAKENADVYENLLRQEVFTGIEKMNVKGYKDIQLLRRELEDEVEFITIMKFENMDAVKQFAGDDYEVAYVPVNARKVLKRFDERSTHFKLLYEKQYNI